MKMYLNIYLLLFSFFISCSEQISKIDEETDLKKENFKGNVIMTVDSISIGGVFKISEIKRFNQNGYMTHHFDFLKSFFTEINYTSDNKFEKSIKIIFDSEGKNHDEKTSYLYDKSDKLISEVIIKDNSEEEKKEYNYKSGYLISSETKSDKRNFNSNFFYNFNTQKLDSTVISETTLFNEYSPWIETTINKYNPDGLIYEKLYSLIVGENGNNSIIKTIYKYDDNRNVITEIINQVTENKINTTINFEYLFDMNGNWISKKQIIENNVINIIHRKVFYKGDETPDVSILIENFKKEKTRILKKDKKDNIESVICEKCRGKGFYPCERCHGRGYMWDDSRCRYILCRGTGKIYCSYCNGTGKNK